jgi:hypothetical protein
MPDLRVGVAQQLNRHANLMRAQNQNARLRLNAPLEVASPLGAADDHAAEARPRAGLVFGGTVLLGGDEGDAPRPRQGTGSQKAPARHSTAPPAPREHSFQQERDAEGRAKCADLKRRIYQHWWYVDWLSRQRDRLRNESDRIHRHGLQEVSDEIRMLEKRLQDAKQELALLNAGPVNQPDCRVVGRRVRCSPGLGPIPDIVKNQRRLALQQEISNLERKIARLRARGVQDKLDENLKQRRKICTELDIHIPIAARDREEYESVRRCGIIDGWKREWRICHAGERH